MMSLGTASILFWLARSELNHVRSSTVLHSTSTDSALGRQRPLY
jgi:hypothetical protein